jgi:WbqC-like protein
MRIAIVQSNYIPWKGYFDLMRSVDEFVLFDDVQYTRRDWRNRNRIKTARGPAWLTIPVNARGQYLSQIKDITVSDRSWGARHWRTLTANYTKARFFREYAERFEQLYLESRETHLSAINRRWLEALCEILGVRTRLSWSMDYDSVEGRTERLVSICQQAGADCYVSGPAARAYLDADCFRSAGIELEYFDYSGYPEYDQLFPPFDHFVSVIDLIFNQGPKSADFMRRQ